MKKTKKTKKIKYNNKKKAKKKAVELSKKLAVELSKKLAKKKMKTTQVDLVRLDNTELMRIKAKDDCIYIKDEELTHLNKQVSNSNNLIKREFSNSDLRDAILYYKVLMEKK